MHNGRGDVLFPVRRRSLWIPCECHLPVVLREDVETAL
jgi:hypothetical protein